MTNLFKKLGVSLSSLFSINAYLFSSNNDESPEGNIIAFIVALICIPTLNILAVIIGIPIVPSLWLSPTVLIFLIFFLIAFSFVCTLSQCTKDDNKIVLMVPCLVANYLLAIIPYPLELISAYLLNKNMNMALFFIFVGTLVAIPVFIMYPMNTFIYNETHKRLQGETSLLDDRSYFVIDGKRLGLFKSVVLLIFLSIRFYAWERKPLT